MREILDWSTFEQMEGSSEIGSIIWVRDGKCGMMEGEEVQLARDRDEERMSEEQKLEEWKKSLDDRNVEVISMEKQDSINWRKVEHSVNPLWKAQTFKVVHDYLQKAESVLENVPKIREGINKLMEDTVVKSEKLMVLLADVNDMNWRKERVDDELKSTSEESLSIVRDNNNGLKYLVNGMEQMLSQSVGVVERISRLEGELDERNREIAEKQVDLAERKKNGLMDLISWCSKLQVSMEENFKEVTRYSESCGLLTNLNSSSAEIKKKINQPIELCEEDRHSLVEVNRLGAVMNDIVSVGNSISVIVARANETDQEMSEQVNNMCLVAARLNDVSYGVSSAMRRLLICTGRLFQQNCRKLRMNWSN
jgi:hypothetical protein